jgi:hypothetical protein
LAHVLSAALRGVDATLVRVEVDVASGLPNFTTVGLPDSAVRESRERVKTAIRNAEFAFPSDRITVNLSPADVRKEGAAFDLPIALGILRATGVVKDGHVGRFAVVGELALDGQIQPVRGVLAVGLACRRKGITTLVIPRDNLHEEPRVREALSQRFGSRAGLIEELGAVSAVGAGINASFATVRRGAEALGAAGVSARGLATSSFRITWMVSRARLEDAVRALHATFIEQRA